MRFLSHGLERRWRRWRRRIIALVTDHHVSPSILEFQIRTHFFVGITLETGATRFIQGAGIPFTLA
jgi:hypothetical protein